MLYILKFIKRYWFIFAIIALYFVLATFSLLPRSINIFHKKKLLIDDTPVVVEKIKEIGELTTAEFYGEVYADLNEVYDDLILMYRDSIIANPVSFYKEYSSLENYMCNFGEQSVKEQEYNEEYQIYKTKLREYIKKLADFKEAENDINKTISEANSSGKKRKLNKELKSLQNQLEKDKKELEQASNRFEKIENKYRKKRNQYWESRKQRNLVYIGRGWVKAGIDLRYMSENDIVIDKEDELSIQILLSDPVILNTDINPWFIYTKDKKVKGFEVFLAKTGSIFGSKNFTDTEVRELKHKCKDKLRQSALDKGLLESARKSAKQTLQNFFQMLGFKNVTVKFKGGDKVIYTEES